MEKIKSWTILQGQLGWNKTPAVSILTYSKTSVIQSKGREEMLVCQQKPQLLGFLKERSFSCFSKQVIPGSPSTMYSLTATKRMINLKVFLKFQVIIDKLTYKLK